MLTAKDAKKMTDDVVADLDESFRSNVLPAIEATILEAIRLGNYTVSFGLKQENLYRAEKILKSFGYSVSLTDDFQNNITITWR